MIYVWMHFIALQKVLPISLYTSYHRGWCSGNILDQCFTNLFAYGPLLVLKNNHYGSSHPCSHKYRVSRWQVFRIKNLNLRTDFRKLWAHTSGIYNNALHDLKIITVTHFVGTGGFLIRYSNCHKKYIPSIKNVLQLLLTKHQTSKHSLQKRIPGSPENWMQILWDLWGTLWEPLFQTCTKQVTSSWPFMKFFQIFPSKFWENSFKQVMTASLHIINYSQFIITFPRHSASPPPMKMQL